MWYNLKQSVENGFKMSFSIRFKRAVVSQLQEIASRSLGNYGSPSSKAKKLNCSPYKMNIEMSEKSNGKDEITGSQTSLCIVIQNGKEISSWKKNAPSRLEDLTEYIVIRINLIDKSLKKVKNI